MPTQVVEKPKQHSQEVAPELRAGREACLAARMSLGSLIKRRDDPNEGKALVEFGIWLKKQPGGLTETSDERAHEWADIKRNQAYSLASHALRMMSTPENHGVTKTGLKKLGLPEYLTSTIAIVARWLVGSDPRPVKACCKDAVKIMKNEDLEAFFKSFDD